MVQLMQYVGICTAWSGFNTAPLIFTFGGKGVDDKAHCLKFTKLTNECNLFVPIFYVHALIHVIFCVCVSQNLPADRPGPAQHQRKVLQNDPPTEHLERFGCESKRFGRY